MKFAEDAADVLELSGELREEFIKEAELNYTLILEHSKTAASGISDQIAKGVKAGLKEKERGFRGTSNRFFDALLIASIGAPMVAGLGGALFGKRREKKRFKGMMEESAQRGYTEITDSTDPEAIEGAFHIVNAYSPSLASHPLLAANATRHVLQTGIYGAGGLDPASIPQLVAAEAAISGQKENDPVNSVKNIRAISDAATNLATSYAN